MSKHASERAMLAQLELSSRARTTSLLAHRDSRDREQGTDDRR